MIECLCRLVGYMHLFRNYQIIIFVCIGFYSFQELLKVPELKL